MSELCTYKNNSHTKSSCKYETINYDCNKFALTVFQTILLCNIYYIFSETVIYIF